MRTKGCVGKFPAIAHLSEDAQIDLIEKARYQAFVEHGMAGKSAGYFFVAIIVGFVIAATPLLFFGYHGWLLTVTLALGLIVSNFSYQLMYARLLRHGLESYLAENQVTNTAV